MLVSHETPIAYLEASRAYNDYDYCLVHLCDEHPEYLQFFKDSLRQGREVLLDNSIFELGEAYDPIKFAERIEEIQPTYYVVPDVLEDAQSTITNWWAWSEAYSNLPGLKIGVVQGKTYNDLLECYKFMADKADYIAISFDYSYYKIIGVGSSDLEKWMTGRTEFISRLCKDGVWRYDKPHHLLGCSLAREFKQYRGLSGIRSLDTSNPVTSALAGERYLKGIGLHDHKPPVKLADQITAEYDLDTERLIMDNCREFKNILLSL